MGGQKRALRFGPDIKEDKEVRRIIDNLYGAVCQVHAKGYVQGKKHANGGGQTNREGMGSSSLRDKFTIVRTTAGRTENEEGS